jgi:uncharacterized protein
LLLDKCTIMQEIIKNNIDKINELCHRHQVKEMFVFGSASTGEFTSASDIDLLVSFFPMDYGDYADNYFALAENLESAFNRPVDLITDKSLSNPFFIKSLLETRQKIYG